MPFTEDLDTFFIDFKDSVIYNNAEYIAFLYQPDEMIADSVVLTTDYELTAKTSELGGLVFDNILKVNGDSYKVRSARKIDDGSFCLVSLTKT